MEQSLAKEKVKNSHAESKPDENSTEADEFCIEITYQPMHNSKNNNPSILHVQNEKNDLKLIKAEDESVGNVAHSATSGLDAQPISMVHGRLCNNEEPSDHSALVIQETEKSDCKSPVSSASGMSGNTGPAMENVMSNEGLTSMHDTQRESINISIPNIHSVEILPPSPVISEHNELPRADNLDSDLDGQVITCNSSVLLQDTAIISSGLSVALPQAVVLTTSALSTLCPTSPSPVATGSLEGAEYGDQQDADGILIPKVEPGQAYIG
ncbi:predicted protein, partial [Nematostella vectensis]